jgi:hypothetical protein
MIRKVMGVGLATAGSLALVGSVFGGDKIKLYGATGERIIQEKIDGACSVSTKLELLKTKVRELDAEVARLEQDAIARRVECDGASARVHEADVSIAHQKQILARAAELLDENQATYEIAGRRYARSDVEADARAKLDACSSAERVLEDEKKIVQVKEKTLALAQAHLERARTRRGELSQAVRSLEARISEQQAKRALAEALDAQPISVEVQGELAKAERLAKEVQTKLEVEERVLDERLAQKNGPTGQIDYEPAKKAEAQDVSHAIRAHLAGPVAPATPAKTPSPVEDATQLH